MPNFGIHTFSQFWWLALLGLLVPLLIHLWNRKEGARILVGSIHWLEESEENKASRVKFSEWWQFLLRLAILSLFLLFLLQPSLKSESKSELKKNWVLLDPSIKLEAGHSTLLDSFVQENYSIRVIPSLEEIQSPFESESLEQEFNYWSLLRKIAKGSTLPDHVTIVGQTKQSQFIGQKPKLPFEVEWIDIPEKTPHYFLATAWEYQDQMMIIFGESGEQGINFTLKSIAPINQKIYDLPHFSKFILNHNEVQNQWTIETEASLKNVKKGWSQNVFIESAAGFEEEKQFLSAALKAVSKYANFNLELKDQLPETSNTKLDWIFLLSDKKPNAAFVDYTQNLVVYEPGKVASKTFFEDQGTYFSLNQALSIDHISNLPASLLNLLLKEEIANLDIPDLRFIDLNQRRTQILKNSPEIKQAEIKSTSLQIWIWLILLLLFLIERLYSTAND